jgi:hypothetical protein
MNMKYLWAGALALLVLAGCPTEAAEEEEDDTTPPPVVSFEGGKGELELTLADGDLYCLDFATGERITNSRSPDWDIAFMATRQAWTNSGITAETYHSRGKGAVWHTESTDFDSVTLEDAVKDDPVYGKYNVDVLRYAEGMAGYSNQAERNMNVMTYHGYPNEDKDPNQDGTTYAKRFLPMYQYNKRGFYEASVGRMPPDFRPTKRVYIIRHGDGEHHSKVQVYKFVRNTVALGFIDFYGVRWENLD